jgi:hypothetical protein
MGTIYNKKYYLVKMEEAKQEAGRAENVIMRESWTLMAEGYEILLALLANQEVSENAIKLPTRRPKLRKRMKPRGPSRPR